ncbi:MAG: prepilin-type cleavage/methylation domain-containing protein [Gammaproteobacteria bacterium]|nr:prepilin-type cleavage/methylation domain-containing protein [Gammaproteobacteria bacterium]
MASRFDYNPLRQAGLEWGACDVQSASRRNSLRAQSGSVSNKVLLAIVGLLLAAFAGWLLLKYLESSRVSQAIEALNGTTAAVFAYQDRYGRTPGDDGPAASLAARGSLWSSVTAGDVDGRLDVGINQLFTGNGESAPFWQQLRAAGFWSGDPAVTGPEALPQNPWGGLVSVLADEMGGGLSGNKVCMSQVPGTAAAAIDSEMDDGDGASGRLRATQGSRDANTNPSNSSLEEPFSENLVYTICYRM